VGSAMVYFEENLYLFGGNDEVNDKLDDFWKFDLS